MLLENLVGASKFLFFGFTISRSSKPLPNTDFHPGVLNDLFDGSQGSKCHLPCVTTHTETKFLNKYASEATHVDLTFSSQVCKENHKHSCTPSLGENYNNGYVATQSQYLSLEGGFPH